MRYSAELDGTETDKEIEQIAFEAFATGHPHEAYAAHPERFLAFAQRQYPSLTREQLERILNEP